MASDTYDLTIDQGADWFWTIRWRVGSTQKNAVPKDVTGYSARMQFRRAYTTPDPPMISLTSAPNGGITVDGPIGSFSVRLTSDQTSALEPGKSVYDFEVVGLDGIVTKISRGTVTVIPEVTR
jgi:hypothetical protein